MSVAGLYVKCCNLSFFRSLKDKESINSWPVREQHFKVPDEIILADKFPSGAEWGSERRFDLARQSL